MGRPPGLWPRQLTKTCLHPLAGPLALDVQQFAVDTQPDQQLVAYTAPPGTPAEDGLRFLLQWAAAPRATGAHAAAL